MRPVRLDRSMERLLPLIINRRRRLSDTHMARRRLPMDMHLLDWFRLQ